MNLFFLKFLFLLLPVLIGLSFLTLLERKFLSLVGLRLGPNKVSLGGFLQPMGDALKLSNKSSNALTNFSFSFYYLSSSLMLASSVFIWFFVYSDPSILSFKHGIIFIMLLLGLNSLNSILSGWSIFCKYSLIGSLRTVAQLISYEASLYLCLFFFVSIYNSFSFSSLSLYSLSKLIILLPVVFYLWLPSFLAELNRTPYDFSEGESELVSGFNTEFGSKGFTMIFMAEYSNILFFCLLTTFFFFFFDFFSFFFFCVYVIWVRSVLPRYRFDKLMMLAWKFLIPFLTLFFMFFIAASN